VTLHSLRCLAGALLTTGAIACAVAPAAPEVTREPASIIDRVIPIDLATDVRWDDDAHVIVTDRRRGPARVAVADADAQPEWWNDWPAATEPGSHYMHLAISPVYAVAADTAFGLRWREQRPNAAVAQDIFEYIADVDARNDQLLITGLRRNAGGVLGADESTAWIGTLRGQELTLRPLLPFRQMRAIENCAGFGLAAVRFLPNGGFVIAPGAEPGVYVYDAHQRLQRTWDTKALGVEVDCNLTREQSALLATDVDARQAWLNRRRIIDDVIAVGDVPYLVVRAHDGAATRWELIELRGERHTIHPLPFVSTSSSAHVSADARGGRIAFLVHDRAAGREGAAATRLVILPWPPH
jgi:hypothetical protein